MRQAVSIILVVAIAALNSVNGELMEFEGCLNGTSLETKFPEAFESCEIDGNDHWEFDTIHQEAADDCDFESLEEAFTEQAEDGICLMTKLGWINEDHTMNQAAISQDMATLDKKVMDGISQYEIQMCLNAHDEELRELLGDDCHLESKQIDTLLAINKKIADYKCLLQAFGRSCVMNSGMYEQPEGSNGFDGFGDEEVPDLDDDSFEESMETSSEGSMEGFMSMEESMEGSMEGTMVGSIEGSMSMEDSFESSEEESDVPDLDDGSFEESDESSEESDESPEESAESSEEVPDIDDERFMLSMRKI